MPTEIYFELQTRRKHIGYNTYTEWHTVYKNVSFTDVLKEYDEHIKTGYKPKRLQLLQIIKQSTVIIPEQLLKVTEITKD